MKTILILFLIIYSLSSPAQNKWQKLNGPEGGIISALFTKGDTILAGTGYQKALIFYSTNRGISWSKADFKTGYPPTDSRINDFVVSNDGGIIAASSYFGLYKSFDLIHWNNIFSNGEDYWSLGKDIDGVLYAGSDAGKIFNSTNNGQNWNEIVSDAPGRLTGFLLTKDSSLYTGSYTSVLKKKYDSNTWDMVKIPDINYIHLCADSSDNIIASTSGYVFLSSDKGLSWKMQDTNHFFFGGNYLYHCIFNNNRLIGACGDIIGFDAGWGIAISDDKGLTWKWSNTGMPPEFDAAYSIAKSDSDTYVGTNAAGVYKSTNYGDSWFPVNKGLTTADAWNINFDNDGNLYAACWSNGVYKSLDKGLSWKLVNNGFTNSYVWSVLPDDKGILFAGTEQGTYRSTDQGKSWNKIIDNFFYVLYKDNNNRIYGMDYGNGVYRSTDHGISWTKIDHGFINEFVFAAAIDSGQNIYVGTRGGAIYKSTDDGTSWTKVYQSTSSNPAISSIAITIKGTIFATDIMEGILRSTDEGLSWQLVKADIRWQDNYPLNINQKGEIYASGSDSKFYKSTDNGDSWQDITGNLALTTVRDIKFDRNDTMYLATDEAVWRMSPDSTVSVKDKKSVVIQYSLKQNYPNPFNPSTTISYSLPTRQNVTLKIYNILGKEIATLVKEEKPEGNYTVNFNAGKLPSGVYFYSIRAGTFSETKKLLLLK